MGGANTPFPNSDEEALLLPAEGAEDSSSSIMSSRSAPLPSTARGGEIDLKLAEEDPTNKPSSSPIPSSFAAEEKLNPSLPPPPPAAEKLELAPPVPRGRPMGWKEDPDEILRECAGAEEPIEDEEADGCPWPSCVCEEVAPPMRLLEEPETT